MRNAFFALTLLGCGALPAMLFAADDAERTIHLFQDDAQVRMASKIYDLKNVTASDIQPFIEPAVLRYTGNSIVTRISSADGRSNSLAVTTATEFMPFVDDLVAKLDRPGKTDVNGTPIEGTGISRLVYFPNYRTTDDLLKVVSVMQSEEGRGYSENATLWWKDNKTSADETLAWVKYCDRPLPQVNITLRCYEIRESKLRDLGIDYLAWKNGPGMNLLDVAYSGGRSAWDKVLGAALSSSASWSYGGFCCAPAFDMSFVRILQQSGNARVAATANITVINGAPASRVTLSPEYSNIVKAPDDHKSDVVSSGIIPDYDVVISDPAVCFGPDEKEVAVNGVIPDSPEFYALNKGCVVFGYELADADVVERNNYGSELGSAITLNGHLTLDFGTEQLLANSVRETDVEQMTGIPFLSRIPVLKYLFGTETTLKEKVYIVITAESHLVHPDAAKAAK
ncbi:MAG: hypothetical protein PHI35_01930 [Victivallaceae bacterium]|nr:hypothetical protein [Victivallaceae bacterium]